MRRAPTPNTSESTLASTRRKQVRIAHACNFFSRGAHFRRSDECTGEPALVHEQQSMGAHETSCRNPHWLALEVLVPHHLLETSAPESPHLALKSESSVPVAEADKVFSAAELAKLAEQSEEDEEYYLRSRLAWMQAETEPVTDRPLAVEHSARLHTHRYELRPRWPRLRSSMTVEQLADACVVLEELHQNFDDADWLWEQIPGDIHKQFEALRDAYSRHRVRVLNGREPVRTRSCSLLDHSRTVS